MLAVGVSPCVYLCGCEPRGFHVPRHLNPKTPRRRRVPMAGSHDTVSRECRGNRPGRRSARGAGGSRPPGRFRGPVRRAMRRGRPPIGVNLFSHHHRLPVPESAVSGCAVPGDRKRPRAPRAAIRIAGFDQRANRSRPSHPVRGTGRVRGSTSPTSSSVASDLP